jgi:hypothetical protein
MIEQNIFPLQDIATTSDKKLNYIILVIILLVIIAIPVITHFQQNQNNKKVHKNT